MHKTHINSILRFLIKYNKVIELEFVLSVVGADQLFLEQVEVVRPLPALMLNKVLVASV